MTIRLWPQTERPRERLLQHGASVLSDAELLAIFLRTGCAGMSAVDLARSAISRFGSLRLLIESEEEDFCQTKGLGSAKYAQLQAVMEMARRYLGESLDKELTLSSSSSVKHYLTAQLRHRSSEVFAVLFLDTQNRMISYKELFQGTIDGASVYPREVVKMALETNCASVILAHNHPSGITEPSGADIHITAKLTEALKLVDIRVLDHIIVGEGKCTSFAEQGLLPPG